MVIDNLQIQQQKLPSNHCACFSFALVSPRNPPFHLLLPSQEAKKRLLENVVKNRSCHFVQDAGTPGKRLFNRGLCGI